MGSVLPVTTVSREVNLLAEFSVKKIVRRCFGDTLVMSRMFQLV